MYPYAGFNVRIFELAISCAKLSQKFGHPSNFLTPLLNQNQGNTPPSVFFGRYEKASAKYCASAEPLKTLNVQILFNVHCLTFLYRGELREGGDIRL